MLDGFAGEVVSQGRYSIDGPLVDRTVPAPGENVAELGVLEITPRRSLIKRKVKQKWTNQRAHVQLRTEVRMKREQAWTRTRQQDPTRPRIGIVQSKEAQDVG
jgi:hypothetical protein